VRAYAVVRFLIRLILAAAVILCIPACGNASPGPVTTNASASVTKGIHDIAAAQLPPQARQTLKLIETGGPYPYRQDGTIFQNREKLLPPEPNGYYREFTVPTQRSQGRGSLRIIAGKNGERYYTPDHYQSFLRIEGTS
jgi:ribonuclease T1